MAPPLTLCLLLTLLDVLADDHEGILEEVQQLGEVFFGLHLVHEVAFAKERRHVLLVCITTAKRHKSCQFTQSLKFLYHQTVHQMARIGGIRKHV